MSIDLLYLYVVLRLMKRFLQLFVVIAVTSVLTGCVQDLCEPESLNRNMEGSIPFQVCAAQIESKTVNEGLSTHWAAGDKISVFHAESGKRNYINDGAFLLTEENMETGLFLGALSEPLICESNDWYFIYPYNEHMTSPDSKVSGQMTVGSLPGHPQLQVGKDDMSHLAGEGYPLYALIRNVPSDKVPSGTMKQLTSLVAVNVVNETSCPVAVSSVGIKASEALVGSFYVDITGEKAVCTPLDETSVSSSALLDVRDAVIDGHESAKFYLAVKPFTAEAGSQLTVSINGSEKTIKLSESVTFEEGRIKTLNVPVKPITHPVTTMKELSSMFGLDSTCRVDSGYVNGSPVDGFLVLGDESTPGSVTLTGTVADFINMTEFGFFSSSWTGCRSALTINMIKVEATFLGYDADYTVTLEQFAEYVGLPSSLFVLRPYQSGFFDDSTHCHNLIIFDEEKHYYGVTENEVDFLLALYGISVEGLRKLINGEDNSYLEKLKQLVPEHLKAYFSEDMADFIIPSFKDSKISVELSTMAKDLSGNKIDPRVAIWGMNVYYTGD